MDEVEHAQIRSEPDDGRSLDLLLEPLPHSIGSARHAVGRLVDVAAGLPEELADDVALLVSELVTNAIVHAATSVRVRASAAPGRVLVAVSDYDPDHAPSTSDRGVEATSGRGLRLVDLLASSWGIEVLETSKVVWFEAVSRPDLRNLRPGP